MTDRITDKIPTTDRSDPGAANRGRRAPAAGSGEVRGSGAGAGGGAAEDFDSDSAAGDSAPPARPTGG